MLAMNTVEKSRLSEFFFCIRAVFKPLWTKTFAKVMKTVTSATRPKSFGARTRARIMVKKNWISCVPHRSKNFQKSDDMMVFLDGIGEK